MKTSWNLLAGLANSAWSAILALAVVPVYIRYLGIESYGLIGFFVTLQSLLQLLDLGLSPTINREVARSVDGSQLQNTRNLLHSLALIYWVFAVFIALALYLAAPAIANHWLQSSNLDKQTLEHSITLMGLIIACRWPVGLYTGALMGAQHLAVSSGINIIFITIGNVGAIGVLHFFSPTIEAYFMWQAAVGLLYAASMRKAAWHIIGRPPETHFDISPIKRVWRFSAGLSGVALTGIVFSQADKFLLSKLLGLDEYGGYMLAVVVVNSIYVIVTPTFNIIYSKFTHLIATGNQSLLTSIYRTGTHILGAILFPLVMFLWVFSADFVSIWTGNPVLAERTAPLIALLSLGSAIHGLMHFPYALQLSNGLARLPLLINLILTLFYIPAIFALALRYGGIGGATAWLLLNIIYLAVGTWLTHVKLHTEFTGKWLFFDIGHPMLLSILVTFASVQVVESISLTPLSNVLLGIVVTLATISLIIFTSNSSRTFIKAELAKRFST